MHKIKEKLMDELYEYEEKAKKMADGKISAGELQTIHMLTDTIKNIDKIEMLEDGGYSHDGGRWGAIGSYDGGSYAHGDNRSNYNHGMSYDDDASYARRKRDSMGRYSREGGKEHMTRKLEEMLDTAENDKQREAIHRCMKELDRI